MGGETLIGLATHKPGIASVGDLPEPHAYIPIQDGNFELPDDSQTGTLHSLFALLQQPTFQMRLDPIAENASAALTFRLRRQNLMRETLVHGRQQEAQILRYQASYRGPA